jgi:hypothetical protein
MGSRCHSNYVCGGTPAEINGDYINVIGEKHCTASGNIIWGIEARASFIDPPIDLLLFHARDVLCRGRGSNFFVYD